MSARPALWWLLLAVACGGEPRVPEPGVASQFAPGRPLAGPWLALGVAYADLGGAATLCTEQFAVLPGSPEASIQAISCLRAGHTESARALLRLPASADGPPPPGVETTPLLVLSHLLDGEPKQARHLLGESVDTGLGSQIAFGHLQLVDGDFLQADETFEALLLPASRALQEAPARSPEAAVASLYYELAHLGAAWSAIEGGDPLRGGELLAPLLQREPDHLLAGLTEAIAVIRSGRVDQARIIYGRLDEAHPAHPLVAAGEAGLRYQLASDVPVDVEPLRVCPNEGLGMRYLTDGRGVERPEPADASGVD